MIVDCCCRSSVDTACLPLLHRFVERFVAVACCDSCCCRVWWRPTDATGVSVRQKTASQSQLQRGPSVNVGKDDGRVAVVVSTPTASATFVRQCGPTSAPMVGKKNLQQPSCYFVSAQPRYQPPTLRRLKWQEIFAVSEE